MSRGNPWFRRDANGTTDDDDARDPWGSDARGARDAKPSRQGRQSPVDDAPERPPRREDADPGYDAGPASSTEPRSRPAEGTRSGAGDGLNTITGDIGAPAAPARPAKSDTNATSIPASALDIIGRGTIGGVSLDAAALRETMELTEHIRDALGTMFYANVFWMRPDLRELFPVGMEQQRGRLVGALLTIVGSLGDQDDPTTYLQALGRDHRKFGVVTEHYDVIGEALFSALGSLLGDEWTSRRHKAWREAYDVIAQVMVDAADEDAERAPAWWDGEVVLHHRLGPDMAIIQVRPHTDYPFRPGQYCSLMTPRRDRMWRSYSIANRPRNDNILEFHVRAEAAGWVSSALVWRTEVGDVLRLGAPQGHDITAPNDDRDLLYIAGGTGIVPIIGSVQQLAHQFDGRRTHLFYAGREQDSMYALPHLESIGARFGGLALVPVISSYGSEERRLGLLGNVVLSYGAWLEHDIYVAGPTALVRSLVTTLIDNGVSMNRIRHDDYGVSGF